jgi:hypothetical protein
MSQFLFLLLFFFQYWGLNSGPSLWATAPALFCDGLFWNRVPWTICPGWLQTVILLISASWVARITGVSHRCWLQLRFLFLLARLNKHDFKELYLCPISPHCLKSITICQNHPWSWSHDKSQLWIEPLLCSKCNIKGSFSFSHKPAGGYFFPKKKLKLREVK